MYVKQINIALLRIKRAKRMEIKVSVARTIPHVTARMAASGRRMRLRTLTFSFVSVATKMAVSLVGGKHFLISWLLTIMSSGKNARPTRARLTAISTLTEASRLHDEFVN